MPKAVLNETFAPALLALADGNIFPGVSIGYPGQALGEVVFNTSMTGYQEILTDPSYAEQMVTLTYPHIGNTGVNEEDRESSRIWAKGLIIREISPIVSNWRSQQSLPDYLQSQKVMAIAQVDTRRLTRLLREKGAQNACITTDVTHPEKAIAAARAYPGLVGMDLAKVVSTAQTYEWTEQTWKHNKKPAENATLYHVVVYDYGVKSQILRLLADRGCKVTVVPAQTSAGDVLALRPHGVVLANGPGDPAVCDYAITAIQNLMAVGTPLLGICLGFQLLALASGGTTLKMKFGHHGANHPVLDILQGRVMITSQNHGFSVDESTLPSCWQITHRSLFDGSLQGFQHRQKPVLGFQGHPEASPGPHDIINIFDQFIALMERNSPHA